MAALTQITGFVEFPCHDKVLDLEDVGHVNIGGVAHFLEGLRAVRMSASPSSEEQASTNDLQPPHSFIDRLIMTVGNGELGLNSQTSQGTTEADKILGFYSLLHGGLEGSHRKHRVKCICAPEPVVDHGILDAGLSNSISLTTLE